MKGLEALKRLTRTLDLDGSVHRQLIIEDKEVIEKELKALEIVKEIVKENVSNWGNVDFNINDYPLLKEVLLWLTKQEIVWNG